MGEEFENWNSIIYQARASASGVLVYSYAIWSNRADATYGIGAIGSVILRQWHLTICCYRIAQRCGLPTAWQIIHPATTECLLQSTSALPTWVRRWKKFEIFSCKNFHHVEAFGIHNWKSADSGKNYFAAETLPTNMPFFARGKSRRLLTALASSTRGKFS